MAYSELIKDINRIRSYIRDFYVYGLYSREEFAAVYGISPRSYDNERRRVESWMQEYLKFYQNSSGKKVFLSVDGNTIFCNPLYRAFKAKSFTKNDVLLHFILMDLFADGRTLDQNEVSEALDSIFLNTLKNEIMLDDKTIRLKLKDLEALGLLAGEKHGRTIRYHIVPDRVSLSLPGLSDALRFFSEAAPLGVIGSFLLDKRVNRKADERYHTISDTNGAYFRFRHHYLMQAIDSEILCELLLAIDEKKQIEMRVDSAFHGSMQYAALPIRIYMSNENGREYLLSWNEKTDRFYFSRLDRIVWIRQLGEDPRWDAVRDQFDREHKNRLWGVSFGGLDAEMRVEHLEMEIRADESEAYILRRLEREKRCGTITKTGPDRYLFSADVYDTMEILPWICTFTGRIVRLECDNPEVLRKYHEYLAQMAAGYNKEDISNRSSVTDERLTGDAPKCNARGLHTLSAGEKAKLAKGKHDLVFHEVYSAYYNAIAWILSLAVRKELTPKKMNDVVQDKAFGESCMYLPDRLLSDEWPLLDDDLGTYLKAEPTMPLTLIQKRWLRSLLEDTRIRLFLEEKSCEKLREQLEGIRPLFTADTFCFFDRFSDGDPYSDPEYKNHFRNVLEAIREEKGLFVSYKNQYGVSSEIKVKPDTIEYSAREDKFRVYASQMEENKWEEPLRLNMSRMTACCKIADHTDVSHEVKIRKDKAIIELVDDENTLERALFHFSFLEKMTERLDNGKFRMTLYYPVSDKTEILIRILSFGHQLNVISQGYIREEIEKRLSAQMELFPFGT